MMNTVFPKSKDLKLSECSFDDMKLQIGERLELELRDSHDHAPIFTRLIGYLRGQGLMVQTPLENGVPWAVREEERILIRVFSGVKAFAFTSTVTRVCVSPFPYLHLSFPSVVHGAEIRKTLRVKVNLAAQLIAGSNTKLPLPVAAKVVDLSVAGVLLNAPPGLGNKGDTLKMKFSFFVEPDHKPVDLEAEAVIQDNLTRKKAGEALSSGIIQYGLAFRGLHWSEAVLLQNLVYQRLIDDYRNIT